MSLSIGEVPRDLLSLFFCGLFDFFGELFLELFLELPLEFPVVILPNIDLICDCGVLGDLDDLEDFGDLDFFGDRDGRELLLFFCGDKGRVLLRADPGREFGRELGRELLLFVLDPLLYLGVPNLNLTVLELIQFVFGLCVEFEGDISGFFNGGSIG